MKISSVLVLLLAVAILLASCSDATDPFPVAAAGSPPGDTTPPIATAFPPGGTYSSPLLISLQADEPATIYYALHWLEADKFSEVYTGPLAISEPGANFLSFFAVDKAGNWELSKTELYLLLISTNPGWTAPVNVSDSVKVSRGPAIATGPDDLIHLIWYEGDYELSVWTIHHASSNDWHGTQATISDPAVPSVGPVLAVDGGGVVHAVWIEYDSDTLCYGNSTNWQGTSVTITQPTSQYPDSPSMAVDSLGTAHLVWAESRMIHYANSGDWSSMQVISNPSLDSHAPSIAIDSSDILHVVWHEWDTTQVIYANSNDWAATATNISNTTGYAYYPSIAVDQTGAIHVAWSEYTDDEYRPEIFYANSGNWSGTRANVSNTPDMRSIGPEIAVDPAGNAHIVWTETVDRNEEVFYANSVDWTATSLNISSTKYSSFMPAIAVDSNGVAHIAWQEVILDINVHTEILCTNSGG